jgi:hypothetical protein
MRATLRQIPAPLDLRSFRERLPSLAWSALPHGSLDFFDRRVLDSTGLPQDPLYRSITSQL